MIMFHQDESFVLAGWCIRTPRAANLHRMGLPQTRPNWPNNNFRLIIMIQLSPALCDLKTYLMRQMMDFGFPEIILVCDGWSLGASWVGCWSCVLRMTELIATVRESDQAPPGRGLRPLSQFDPSHLSATEPRSPSRDTRFLKTDN